MKAKDKEKIKQAILKSGFPLQIEVSGILTKDYEVYNNVYFFDPDEKKARELDIEAFMSTEKGGFDDLLGKNEWCFSPTLLIECKKSEEFSWVFFDSKPISRWLDTGHSIDRFTARKGYSKSACAQVLTEKSLKHYLYSKYVTGTYLQIKRNGSITGKNEILDALSKIVKFMNYKFENFKKNSSK